MNGFALETLGRDPLEQEMVSVEQSDAAIWRGRVAPLVRALGSLSGPPLAGNNVLFLDNADFASRFPAAAIPRVLLNLFLAEGDLDGILRDNNLTDWLEGMRDERSMQTRIARLRTFINDRISRGSFEHKFHAPPNPQDIVRVTPRELIAGHVGGFTTAEASISSRRIFMQVPGPVETFVHEVCHFYTHASFRTAADTRVGTRLMAGLLMSEIWNEGMTEFFARQVMRQNEAVFGTIEVQAYEGYFQMAGRIVQTAGEASARRAFFKGVAADINRLLEASRLNAEAFPLAVPDFMIP